MKITPKLSHSLSVLCLASALALCAQSPVLAQTQMQDPASGWYAGGSLGSSSIKLRTDNISSTIDGQQETRDTGYKLLGGYQFNNNWAAELQYFDLGKYKYTDIGGGSATVKTHGLALSGVGIFPVAQKVSILGKLGLARQTFAANAIASDGETFSDKVSKTTLVVGVGAEYEINKNLSLRAEYEYFGVPTVPTVLSSGDQKVKLRTDLFSVGLRYRF